MKKPTFEQKYPLLDGYIINDTVKRNLLINNELYTKYNLNYQLIKAYLHEMDKYFLKEETNAFLVELFFKFDDKLFASYLVSFLNSTEGAKKNPETLNYFKKTLSLGTEAILYVEKNGIIANKNYVEIPKYIESPEKVLRVKTLDNEYLSIRSGNEKYKKNYLSEFYFNMNEEEKTLVNALIKNESFDLLENIFSVFNYSLQTLITILSLVKIDDVIISKKVYNELGNSVMMMLIYYLIELDLEKTTNNIKYLISIDRFDLIKDIVMNNLVSEVGGLSKNELDIKDDEVIITILNKRAVKTKIKDKF